MAKKKRNDWDKVVKMSENISYDYNNRDEQFKSAGERYSINSFFKEYEKAQAQGKRIVTDTNKGRYASQKQISDYDRSVNTLNALYSDDVFKKYYDEDQRIAIKQDINSFKNADFRKYYQDYMNTSDYQNSSYNDKQEYLNDEYKNAKQEKAISFLSSVFNTASSSAVMQGLPTKANMKQADSFNKQSAEATKNASEAKQRENKYDQLRTELWNDKYTKSNLKAMSKDKKLSELVEKAYKEKNTIYSLSKQQTKGLISADDYYASTVNAYNSYMEQIGKMGYDADSLFDTYTREQNRINAEAQAQRNKKLADESPVLASAAYVGSNVLQLGAVPEAIASGVANAIDGEYTPMDTNTKAFAPTRFRQTVSQTISENIEREVQEKTNSEFWGNAASFAYQTGLSIGDFASVALLPKPVSLAIMGTSAGVTAVKDATDRGVSADQALMTGLWAGAAEIVFEKFSLGNFKTLKESGKSGITNAIKDIMKQFVTEGSEEVFTDIANAIGDQIFNGNKSELESQYNALVKKFGGDTDKARKVLAKSFGLQLAESFAGGAISGGIMGSFGTAMNNYNLSRIGKDIQSGKSNITDLSTLMNVANKFDENSNTSKLLAKLVAKKNPTNANIGELYSTVVKDVQKTFNKLDSRQALGTTYLNLVDNVGGEFRSVITNAYHNADNHLANGDRNIEAVNNSESGSEIEENTNNRSASLQNNGSGEAIHSTTISENNTFSIPVVTATGSNEAITQVASTYNGDITFKTDTGKTVSINDIDLPNNSIKAIVNDAANFGTSGASVFIKNATGKNMDNSTYRTFAEFSQQMYNFGVVGSQWDVISKQITPMINKLGYDTAKEFYDAGVADKSKTEFQKILRAKKTVGATVLSDKLNAAQQAEIELIGEYAKHIGREVIVVDDTEKLGYGQANGFYENGKIVLALNADGGMMSVYFGHELFHDLKVTSKKQSQKLEDFIIDYLKNNADYNYDARVEELIELNDFEGTREQQIAQANEEIAANACFTVLSEKENFESLVKQDKSLAQKVRDFFADFIEKIKNALQEVSKRNAEYRALKDDIAKQKILAMFDECLDASKDDTVKNDNQTKLSIKEDEFGKYVDVDTDQHIVKGKTLKESISIINKYMDKKFRGKVFPVSNNSKAYVGHIGVDEYSHPARKNIDNDILFSKLKAGTELDNLLAVSVFDEHTEDNGHHPEAVGGWDYYTTVFKVGNNFYQGKVSIEIRQNGREFKDITKIKGITRTANQNANASVDTSHSSNTNISQDNTGVNSNNMQDKPKYALKEDSEGNKLSDEQIRRYRNVAPELRDEQGRIKPFYHGTSRADRVGNYFNPDRATSGPMVYFTDNEKIAGNYSRDKSDTSIAYDSDYDSYETQFRLNGKPITDYWYTLSPSEKRDLTDKIKQVTLDDDDNVILKQNNEYGIGNFNDYELHMANGNALQVLVDGWLNGGTLWNEENRFIDVLDAIGIKNAEYKNPDYREEKVYKVYLNITNPFNTSKVDDDFISDLESYVSSVDMSKYDTENSQADMWDKNAINIEDWIERLKDDLNNGTTHAWTSIPDVVTDFLKEYGGHNGIIDKGGKHGGEIHTVAIPFYSNQIKNIDNTNPTDNVDIRYSRKESIDIDDFKEEDYNYPKLGKTEYKRLYTEMMRWHASHINQIIRHRRDNGYRYICMLDDNYSLTVLGKYKSINIHERYKNDDGTRRRIDKHTEISGRNRGHGGNSVLSTKNTESTGNNAEFNGVDIQQERQSNRRGNAENGNYDYSREKRYSVKEQPVDYNTLLEKNEELSALNENLQRMLEFVSTENNEIREQFDIRRVHTTENSGVAKVAAYLRKQYTSHYNKKALISRLSGLFNYIANAGTDIDNGYIWNTAKGIAANIVEATEYKDTTLYDENKELRNYIRNTAISVPSDVKKDMGDFEEFRKRNFGKIRISQKGISLDTFFSELANTYPQYFSSDAVSSDQLAEIENFFNYTSPIYYNGAEMAASADGLSLDEYTNIVAADILEQYFDIPEVSSLVSKSHQEELEKIQENYKQQISEMQKTYRENYEDRLIAFKSAADSQLAEQKAHFEDLTKKGKERQEKRKYRRRIEKNAKSLSQWLLNPKKEHSIPTVMQEAVTDFLNLLNFDTGRLNHKGGVTKHNAEWALITLNLKSKLNEVKNGNLEENEKKIDYQLDIPDFIIDTVHAIYEMYRNDKIDNVYDMSLKDLQRLDDCIRSLKYCITKAHKLMANAKYESVVTLGDETIREFSSLKKKAYHDSKLRQIMNFEFADAFTVKDMFGDAGGSVIDSLYRGFEQQIRLMQFAKSITKDIIKDKNIKTWSGKHAEMHKFVLDSGNEIVATPAQMMMLYLSSKREQAVGHLTGQGMVLSDEISKISKHRINKINRESDKSIQNGYDTIASLATAYILTPNDISTIISELTDEQKEVADQLQRIMADTCAKWGNEVTQELYGYDGYVDKDYVPIQSAPDWVRSMDNNAEDNISYYAVANQSFTKSVVKGANNPIVIGDIFDVFANHLCGMIRYNAYAIPLSDAMKWINYKSYNNATTIKHEMHCAYGSGAEKFMRNLIKQLNGTQERAHSDDLTSSLISRSKASAVAFNARVAIQQPTAYLKASLYIDEKYMIKAVALNAPSGIKKAKKYCPVALWKSWGFFDTDISRGMTDLILDRHTALDRISEVGMKGAEFADEWTWGVLWNACELYVQDNYAELKVGTEEYYSAVSDKLTEIINYTQVVDSPFHKTQIMRSKSTYVKMATAFMTEPMKSYNMLKRAAFDAYQGKKGAGKKLGKTMYVYAITQAAVSAMAAIVDAFREDDDESTWWERYWQAIKNNLVGENFLNSDAEWYQRYIVSGNISPFGLLPFAKDVLSLIDGFDASRLDMGLAVDLIDLCKALDSENSTPYRKAYLAAKTLSAATGLPFGNIMRTFKTIFNTFSKKNIDKFYTTTEKYEKYYEYTVEGDNKYLERIKKELSDQSEIQIANGVGGILAKKNADIAGGGIAYLNGDTDNYMSVIEDLQKQGFTERQIKAAIKKYSSLLNAAKEALDTGDTERYDEIFADLTESGYDAGKIEATIKDIELEENNKVSYVYTKNEYYRAIENESSYADEIYESISEIDELNGKNNTRESLFSGLKTYFKSEYGTALFNGDSEKATSIENKLKASGLFNDDELAEYKESVIKSLKSKYKKQYLEEGKNVDAWINSPIGSKEDVLKWEADSYNTASMKKAFKGGYDATRTYVSERIKAKTAIGQDEKTVLTTIKSDIAKEYKDEFINGNADTRAKIKKYMIWSGVYGNPSETTVWIDKNWLN